MSHKSLFYSFMSKMLINKGSSHTHTSMNTPKGSYYIQSKDNERFYDLYTDALKNNETLHITEKHKDISPILIDFDFRLNISDGESYDKHSYSTEDILYVLNTYMVNLMKYVHTPMTEIEIYFQEKSQPVINYDKNIVKDGFHIIIPDIVTRPSVQNIIRQNILEQLHSYLQNKIKYVNTITDVFDEDVIYKNNWMMYGSCKPDCESYKVTRVFNYNVVDGNIVELSNITERINDIDALVLRMSIRNKYDENKILHDKYEEVQKYEEFMTNKKKIVDRVVGTRMNNKKVTTVNSDELETIKKVIMILSPTRSDNYNDWIRLGWCLRNIDNSLLPTWIEFSKLSSKYTDGECDKVWSYMREGELGVGTLYMWARKDNYDMYKDIVSKDVRSLVIESLTATDYDIGRVIFKIYAHEYKCVSIDKKKYYEFVDHRWQECEQGYTLRNKMSTEVFAEYRKVNKEFATKMSTELDPGQQKNYETNAKIAKDIANKLKMTNFKSKMIQEVSDPFYRDSVKFEEKLNSSPYLICFTNGVYDLENFEFREGRPEDHLSFTTRYDYEPLDVENDKYYTDVMDFVNSVLPNENVRKYVMTLLASSLDGLTKDEKFNIWTGTGSNGKSKLLELLQHSMGEYVVQFNVSLLTGKRVASNATNSEIVRSKGKRLAILQEPEENEKMNIGIMKEYTGGDTIVCRGLYKESIEFKPMFKMILTCNHMPTLPANDDATWRRIRRVEFTSKFTDNPHPEKPNEYKIDRNLSLKFKQWKKCFMGILIEYYKDYAKYGLVFPKEILAATEEYQKEQDSLADFCRSNVSLSANDENAKLQMDELFNAYRNWCMDENIKKILTKKDFTKEMVVKFGKLQIPKHGKSYWTGYILNINEEDDHEYDG